MSENAVPHQRPIKVRVVLVHHLPEGAELLFLQITKSKMIPVVPTPSLGTVSACTLAGHTSTTRAQELQAHNSAATLLLFCAARFPEPSPDFGLAQTPSRSSLF